MDSPEQLDLNLHSFSDLERQIWHFNVAFIGSSRSGKTKLLQRFVDSRYSEIYSSTNQVDFVSKSVSLGQHHVVFQCWDTPGCSRSASCLDPRLAQLHAVFIVFDGSRDAIADLEHWHHLALKSPSGAAESGQQPPLIVMVANKTDLGCHQASMTRARELCSSTGGLVFSLSVQADEENLEVDAMMMEVGKLLTERNLTAATSPPTMAGDRNPLAESAAAAAKSNSSIVHPAAGDDADAKSADKAKSEPANWCERICCCFKLLTNLMPGEEKPLNKASDQ